MSYVFAFTDAHEPEHRHDGGCTWAGCGPWPEDENRDLAEEAYWREFCQACGDSPCTWDGTPDGFHTDDGPEPPDTDDLPPAEFLAAWQRLGCTATRYDLEADGLHHDTACPAHPWVEPPDTLRELREPE